MEIALNYHYKFLPRNLVYVFSAKSMKNVEQCIEAVVKFCYSRVMLLFMYAMPCIENESREHDVIFWVISTKRTLFLTIME